MTPSEKGSHARVKPASGQPASAPASPLLRAAPRVRHVGERGLLLDCLTDGGDDTLARLAQLRALALPEVADLVPADGSLLVVLHPGAACPAALHAALAQPVAPLAAAHGVLHEIAVIYDGEDLPALARAAQHTVSDYIRAHSAVVYRVAFNGFQPGFAYLTGLPAPLAAPRRAHPRTHVPAGSVAIGGAYCGIYPHAGPGGWQLVGHCRARLFDPAKTPPALFAPGDRVRFVPR